MGRRGIRMAAADQPDLSKLPREIELLALAYASDLGDVGAYFLERCWVGDLGLARAVAVLFDLAASGGFCWLTARIPEAPLRELARDADQRQYWYSLLLAGPRPGELAALALACEAGHLGQAQWISDYFGFADNRAPEAHFCTLLSVACVAGQLDTARWLADRFSAAMPDTHVRWLLERAYRSGSVPLVAWVADWLTADGRAAHSTVRASARAGLPAVCAKGHADLARWLITHFGLTRAEAYTSAP